MNVVIIPARGGSQRIPRKNIKEFAGQPMIAWPIKAALESGCFDKVIVSTDDEEIALVAQKYGAETPFRRPESLSDHFTGTAPVVRHAIEYLIELGKQIDVVCCLYATSPFITPTTLQTAMQKFIDFDNNSNAYVFSVASYPYPIQRAVKLNEQGLVEFREPEYAAARSQDLEPMYHDAGQFYIGKAATWLAKKSVFSSGSLPFVLDRSIVQDIDTEEDWSEAELKKQVLVSIASQGLKV